MIFHFEQLFPKWMQVVKLKQHASMHAKFPGARQSHRATNRINERVITVNKDDTSGFL